MRYGNDGSRHPSVNEYGIYGFFDEYRFLSNFHESPLELDGMTFSCSEAAYMAGKFIDPKFKSLFTMDNGLSPSQYKKLGRTLPLRKDWEDVKVLHMTRCLFAKFSQNSILRQRLIDTGDKYLEETNDWNDTFWGCDLMGQGRNMLGQVLMHTRDVMRWVDK